MKPSTSLFLRKKMNENEAKIEIEKLREKVDFYNYHYYVLSESLISDFEFDKLLSDLQNLENQFPRFFSPESPTQRVGGSITKEFQTVIHRYPMLSLSNSYSSADIKDFDDRVRKAVGQQVTYCCELKYDGVAIGLRYEKGVLTKAVTRGDGIQGDDVTANVKTIKSIPLKLRGNDYPEDFEIRGEIFMPRSVFEAINAEREEQGEPRLANPRNAASGTLKQQDSRAVAERRLDCYLYLLLGENLGFTGHLESLHAAAKWGFKISPHTRAAQNLDEVNLFIKDWESKRFNLDVETDGVVIKVDEIRLQNNLGFTAKTPRWAVAFKYKAQEAVTKLQSVSYQVGRTGAVTPVANLEPVWLAGTMVKRASLHNADIISDLDLHEGDTVMVEKGGEIIPKITGVVTEKRNLLSRPVSFISHCPECQTALQRRDGEAQHFCPNEKGCPPQQKARIEHFTSRKAMNIDSLGPETIALLYQAGLVKNIADLYSLSLQDLLPLERMAAKSAGNILEGINNSKKVPFERVLFALGIRHVGETLAKKLARNLSSLENISKANKHELMQVNDVGEKIADSILLYFSDPESLELVNRLREAGLQLETENSAEQSASNILNGKTFVVSGVFHHYSRDGIKEAIENNGGKVSGSISSKTNFVLAGEEMGPAKLEKAKKLGVAIISEDDFLKMIEKSTQV